MKIVFWIQVVFSVIAMTLNTIVTLTGGRVDPAFDRHAVILFLISAGFLWIHSAIANLRVKP